MLTEPDMQARYVAATLCVIETELLRNPESANNRRALSALVAGASRAAARLAEELERRAGPVAPLGNPPAAAGRRDEVGPVQRRKSAQTRPGCWSAGWDR